MKKNILIHLFWAGVNVATAILFLCTLAGFLGTQWWIFDILSHFRVQYLFGLVLLLLVYGVGRKRSPTIITGLVLCVNLILIIPLYIRPANDQADTGAHRIFYANVRTENQKYHLIQAQIADTDPDFVVLLEVNQAWLDTLELDDLGYRYYVGEPRSDNFGIAIYSRYPLEESEIRRFGRWDVPTIIATANVDGAQITFIATHPVPPKGDDISWHRNIQMSELAEFIAEMEGTIILAADLNASSWSPHFRDWVKVSRLQDSRRGFGIQPTWPTFNRLFLVPIDHFLITSNVQVHHREVGPNVGSDHYPLIMEFSISDNTGEN